MEIKIQTLTNTLKGIAKKIDFAGNNNDKIDNNEVSLFKAKFASLVRMGKASDFEYSSIFGNSAWQEWTQTKFENHELYSSGEYSDANGNKYNELIGSSGDVLVSSKDNNNISHVYHETELNTTIVVLRDHPVNGKLDNRWVTFDNLNNPINKEKGY